MILRVLVGVAAAWITPDPLPQPSASSAYEESYAENRCHLRLVR